ncbi:MAG: DNA polymerase III subunit delta [Acidobacteria bacterium]|nr:DNA polymerase III subunit delta [Acidobacteriota bacterium]
MGREAVRDQTLAEQIAKGQAALIYCLYGEDDYRREQALKQLLDALLPEDSRALNLDQIRPGEAETGSILGSARTPPFLSARRVVLVRGADALSRPQQEEVLAYLDDPSPTTCLVLNGTRLDLRTRFAAALQKKGMVLRFDRLEGSSMKDSLQRAAWSRGKQISPEAIELLIALAGDDLRQLISGVEKATLFVGEREEIGPRDIEALIGETRARSIFQLTDAVGARNLEVALRCLASLLENGEEPLPILGMLARQIRLLFQAKTLHERGATSSEMARTLGLPPRPVAVLAEQGASLSWQRLADAHQCLYRADLAIKTGRAGAPAVLRRLVWDLCKA